MGRDPGPSDVAPGLSVSVVVPVRNERTYLPGLLRCLETQTLRPMEVIFADGRSSDGTRQWLDEMARQSPWLKVVDNPELFVPTGMNRAIAVARGDIVARMDGHVEYACDYLERLVAVLRVHPEVVGVGGALDMAGETAWARASAAVLRRPLGLGGAPHRRRERARRGPTQHVGSGAYRRDAVLAVDGFDPTFLANQDFEMDQRLRAAGGVIWLEPDARLVYYTRKTPWALARQMGRYGFFKARTLWKHPHSLRPRQLAPPALFLGIGVLAIARRRAALLAAAGYLSAAASAGAFAARADGASAWRGAAAVPIIHLSWGAGLLAGAWVHRDAQRNRVGCSPPVLLHPALEDQHVP